MPDVKLRLRKEPRVELSMHDSVLRKSPSFLEYDWCELQDTVCRAASL